MTDSLFETQTLIGTPTLQAPEHTQAWDGQLALVIGLPIDDEDNECEGHESLAGEHMGEAVYCDGSCRPARKRHADPQAELDAAIKAYGDALDQPRADLAALRLRVSRAYAALEA